MSTSASKISRRRRAWRRTAAAVVAIVVIAAAVLWNANRNLPPLDDVVPGDREAEPTEIVPFDSLNGLTLDQAYQRIRFPNTLQTQHNAFLVVDWTTGRKTRLEPAEVTVISICASSAQISGPSVYWFGVLPTNAIPAEVAERMNNHDYSLKKEFIERVPSCENEYASIPVPLPK
ncbi:hypothetical protein V7968_32850 [Nocardia vulneris]|uniref:hypothetical protein n=1 Tax=Nocardia vulneris TaxID=1141657 RepID=UPI0030CD9E7A